MTDSLTSLREQLLQLQRDHASGTLEAARFETRKAELERQLLDAVMAAPPLAPAGAAAAPPIQPPGPVARASAGLWLGVGVLVLAVAGLGYSFTGAPQVVGKTSDEVLASRGGVDAAAAQAPAGAEPAPTRAQVEAMVVRLAEGMQSRPDDAQGWLMLGRAYLMLDRPADAIAAYGRLLKLRPDDASTLVEYADALALQNGRSLDGEPTRLIERALTLEPDNLKALVLAGTAAYNRNDDAKAVAFWDRAVRAGPADDSIVEMARDGAAAARARGGLPPAAAPVVVAGAATATTPAAPAVAPTATATPAAAAAAASSVSGTVRLAENLKRQASPEDTVFIFARPADGARMPLAIVRKQVKDLPAAFTLDDTASMSPAARLSGAQRVIVGARISKSGQAMPQPGDLQGLSAPVQVGATGVVVEISALVP